MTCSECPICFDIIKNNNNYIVTECGHHFHANCLLKSVSMNNHCCPMCRAPMVETTIEDEEDLEDTDSIMDSEDLDNADTFMDMDSDDFRNDEDVVEDYRFRGFRWLFQQQLETEPSTQSTSMFDGNSMVITPNSRRRMLQLPQDTQEDNESDDEYDESLWNEQVQISIEKLQEIKNIETFLKNERKISYNDLVACIVYNSYKSDYDVIEITSSAERIQQYISDKIEEDETLSIENTIYRPFNRPFNTPLLIDEIM